MKIILCSFAFALLLAPAYLFSQSHETRKLSPFSILKVGGSFETVIEQGSEESAIIDAEGVDTKRIITEQSGNTLKVYLEEGNYHNIRVKVHITYNALRALSQSGSGKLTCMSDLAADEFSLGSSGSGGLVIKGKIKAAKLDIGVSGSGGADVAHVSADNMAIGISGSGGLNIDGGEVKSQVIEVAGSGSLRAFGVKSENATVSLAGSGGADIFVDHALSGTIAGSGNINYKGNGNITSVSTAGSGRIRKS